MWEFVELFQGRAGLSAAVTALCPAVRNLSGENGQFRFADLLNDEVFAQLLAWLQAGRAAWFHAAPNCRTFSSARRKDQYASARVLRTKERPEGFGDPITKEANIMAERSAALAEVMLKMGGWFSIENPESSLMWDMKAFKRLIKLPDVLVTSFDQCMWGSPHKKPTTVITNASWIPATRCSMTVPHRHIPLVGKVPRFGDSYQEMVWYTTLAAEYPQQLCQDWAEKFRDNLHKLNKGQKRLIHQTSDDSEKVEESPQKGPKVVTSPVLSLGSRVPEPKALRELENRSFPGGLRNPHRAVARSPSLRATGGKIRGVLGGLPPAVRQELLEVAGAIGTPTARGFSETTLMAVRTAIFKAFSTVEVFPEWTGTTRYDFKLWQLLLASAEDPDCAVVPAWLEHGCPTGIGSSVIEPTGVFPPTEGTSSAIRAAQVFKNTLETQGWSENKHKN